MDACAAYAAAAILVLGVPVGEPLEGVRVSEGWALMSIHVLDTDKWSAEQAIIAASQHQNTRAVFIVTVSLDGYWDSWTGGTHKTPDLLLAAEVLRRRAFQSMEGWT